MVIGVFSTVGTVALVMLSRLATRSRRVLRARRVRRRTLHGAAVAESRARAMMSELCPFGWRATITVCSPDGCDGRDPEAEGDEVVLDWAELGPLGGRPNVVRRVRAATIAAALESMVGDRRTDETLEQIEQRASYDGAAWPDR